MELTYSCHISQPLIYWPKNRDFYDTLSIIESLKLNHYQTQNSAWRHLITWQIIYSIFFKSFRVYFDLESYKQLAHFVFGRSFILSDCFCLSWTSFSLTPNLCLPGQLFDFSANSTTINFIEDMNRTSYLHCFGGMLKSLHCKNEVYNKIHQPS